MEIKKTITSLFILPTLKISKNLLEINGFINAYSIDGNLEHQYADAIYLLFLPENLDAFKTFVEKEYSGNSFSLIDDYDYDGGHVVLVYRLNPHFEDDYKLIKAGKYSKTSKNFQSMFPEEVELNGKKENSLQFKIFNKTQDLRVFWEGIFGINLNDSHEVWAGFDIDKETLKIQI